MGSLRRFRGPSGSPSSQNSATTFDVVAGFHQGVRLPLNRAEYRIGSTAGSDIVLRDPGVAPVHAVLRVERKSVRLEAIGGDVVLDVRILAEGHGCRVRLPVEFAIGQARLRISPAAAGSAKPVMPVLHGISGPLLRRPVFVLAVILATLLGVSVLTLAMPKLPRRDDAAIDAASRTLALATSGPSGRYAGTVGNSGHDGSAPLSTVEQAAPDLAARLTAAGLTHCGCVRRTAGLPCREISPSDRPAPGPAHSNGSIRPMAAVFSCPPT